MTPPIRAYSDETIAAAAAIIADGGIVAIPTETVYGLAADATNAGAVARIYAAKGRPAFNPLIVHVLDVAAAESIAVFDDDAHALAAAFWPGPLTLVLPVRADAGIASLVTAGLDTVAVRVPRHRAIGALLAAAGVPLAAPSANASGAISPTRAAHVAASLRGRVPLIVDDGACAAGVESTIVAGRAVLRPGPITSAEIAAQLPDEGRDRGTRPDDATVRDDSQTDSVTAPGQLPGHYAPSKPLRLNAETARPGEYLIGFGDIAGDQNLSPDGDLVAAAANLFDALHRADASDNKSIAVARIPMIGIGEAIADRLRRAAHK